MMVFRLTWWSSLLPRRRHTADAAAAATAPPQQQQQHFEEQEQCAKRRGDVFGVSSTGLRDFMLGNNSVTSPFHRFYYALLLMVMYVALLLGGAVGLPWLLLCCWPMWTIRMLSFSWGGFTTVHDLFWLPEAVRAFQQRLKQSYVKQELRRTLREELKGMDVAAFLGENITSNNNSDNSSSSGNNRNVRSGSVSGGGLTDRSFNSGRDATAAADGAVCSVKTHTTARGGGKPCEREQEETQNVPEEAAADNRNGFSVCGSSRTEEMSSSGAVAAAARAEEKEKLQQKEQQEAVASVRRELQQANILRQQRAAAAAAAAAAANARRLGLTSLADCQRRAGRSRLSEEDLEQLLRGTYIGSEVDSIFSAVVMKREDTGLQTRREGRTRVTRCMSESSRTTSSAVAAAVPTRPSVPAARAACSAMGSVTGSHGTNVAVPVSAAGNPTVPAAAATAGSGAAAWGESSDAQSCRPKSCASSRETAAEASSSVSSSSFSSSPSFSSSSAEGVRGGTGNPSAAGVSGSETLPDRSSSARGSEGVQQHSSVNSSSSQDTPLQENTRSSADTAEEEEGKGTGKGRPVSNGDGRKRDNRRRWSWTRLIPWNLIFRGSLAHFQCAYLVDWLFCHAELSPLSSSIPREVLLLLHCLIRGLTVFCVFASPYCYTPYFHQLRTRQLLSSLFTCVAVSFGACAFFLSIPVFVEEILEPLLRAMLLPHMLGESELLQLLVSARLVLPVISLSSTDSTWQLRADFYDISQVVTLAVITAGAYAAVRLHDTEFRVAAAAKRSYATDLLALLTLQTRQQKLRETGYGGNGVHAGALTAPAAEVSVLSDASKMKNARVQSMIRCREHAAGATGNRGDSTTTKETTAVSHDSSSGDEGEMRSISEHDNEGRGRGVSREERQPRRTAGTEQRRDLTQPGGRREEEERLSDGQQKDDKTCSFVTLVLAEKVAEERVFLEKSGYELFRARVAKRLLYTGGAAVAACSLLMCWAIVVFLAVSNVAMRVNTPSDIFQEQENARMMSTAAAAASLLAERTGAAVGGVGIEEWAEEMRLLQEELRDVMNFYKRRQQQQGWFAATIELWEKLGEEFTAAREDRAIERKREMSPYAVLGIKPSATGADIKKAYKLLAKQLHPDLLTAVASNKPTTPAEIDAATERMRNINAAYEQLMRKHGGRGGKSTT